MNVPSQQEIMAVPENGKPSFHIAFCVDNNYFRAMGGTIASIVANNPGQHFTFHVLAFEVSEEHQRRLKQLESMYRVKTELHLLDLATSPSSRTSSAIRIIRCRSSRAWSFPRCWPG
jgi:UDP-glucose:(glucosyl)LPS alpha-1,3-glucosyltransferase